MPAKKGSSVRHLTLTRLLTFLTIAEQPVTIPDINGALGLGGKSNVKRYMREFVRLGLAEEGRKWVRYERPRPTRGDYVQHGRFMKVWQRRVRLIRDANASL